MRERTYDEETEYSWIVYAAAVMLVGVLGGYVLTTATGRPGGDASAAPAAASEAPGGARPADAAALQAYRDILARDPKNVRAAIGAANLLYDARRFAEAVPYYQQACALSPADIDISTDLGTALWYSGHPDEAVAQYGKSLALDPTHAQTLVNLGIVQMDGRHDAAAAIKAWETLVAAHPDVPDAARARQLIADARR